MNRPVRREESHVFFPYQAGVGVSYDRPGAALNLGAVLSILKFNISWRRACP